MGPLVDGSGGRDKVTNRSHQLPMIEVGVVEQRRGRKLSANFANSVRKRW